METVRAYQSIGAYLQDLIAKGEGQHTPLPSESELVERFGVSRMTVRRAYERLVHEGAVVRYSGRGSFASPGRRAELRVDRVADPPDQWAFQKRPVVARVITLEVRVAPQEVLNIFGLPAGGELCYLERIRYTSGRPASWDIRWMPRSVREIITSQDLREHSLLTLLPEHGFDIKRGWFDIQARSASDAEGNLLEIEPGSAVLERRLIFVDLHGELKIVGTTVYAAERVTYQVSVTLER